MSNKTILSNVQNLRKLVVASRLKLDRLEESINHIAKVVLQNNVRVHTNGRLLDQIMARLNHAELAPLRLATSDIVLDSPMRPITPELTAAGWSDDALATSARTLFPQLDPSPGRIVLPPYIGKASINGKTPSELNKISNFREWQNFQHQPPPALSTLNQPPPAST